MTQTLQGATNFDQSFEGIVCVTSSKRLEFGDDPDHDAMRMQEFVKFFLPLQGRGKCTSFADNSRSRRFRRILVKCFEGAGISQPIATTHLIVVLVRTTTRIQGF